MIRQQPTSAWLNGAGNEQSHEGLRETAAGGAGETIRAAAGRFTLSGGSSATKVVNLQTATGQSKFLAPLRVTLGVGNETVNLATGGRVKFVAPALFDGGLGGNTLNRADANIFGSRVFRHF